jgi:thioredoxin reductase (NADPH)
VGARYDVIIGGSGIAGLTAALTSARLGRRTMVLTGDTLGGQLLSINKVDGYPGFPDGIAGYDLCPIAQEQAVAAGAEFQPTEIADLGLSNGQWAIVTGAGETLEASAVILATGASLKKLGVLGEERLFGKGVSHCASCDAPLLKNKVAVVVGGADSAMQEALTLAEFAAKVHILHRGAALAGQSAYRDAVTQNPKIEIHFDTQVEEIMGEANVTGVRTKAGDVLPASGVFVYIGLQPNASFLAGMKLDAEGRIPTDGAMRSVAPGLCAAGAVRSGWLGRAVLSAGEGSIAAIAADNYLRDDHWR